MSELTCFKAYDIRGKLGEQLNEDIVYRIGRATGVFLKRENPNANTVVVGGDIRLTSESLKAALAEGFIDAGMNVLDLGMTGTEEVYFATKHLNVDGGVEVTASHNPIDYNGLKLVREQSKPISNDTGLLTIKAMATANDFPAVEQRGTIKSIDLKAAYVEHMLSYIDVNQLKPMKLVVNAGNGAAGPVIDKIESIFSEKQIPVEFIKVNHTPDGTFPNGIPNPILPECRSATAEAVIQHQADMGIAWDGDFDRCFLFDEKGQFIEGYYIVGLLAEAFLKKNQGEKVIHDPRLYWNTESIAKESQGEAVLSKTGHAFIKEKMRAENAIYGGEMSAHHYFRDFAYCDSGMIPWLLVAEMISTRGITLSAMVNNRIEQFPSSGEINRSLTDPKATIAHVKQVYGKDALAIDETDGLSLSFATWRFNLRCSNTEPVIRLNVESRGDTALMKTKTNELLELLV